MADNYLILHRKWKQKDYTIGQLYRLLHGSEVYMCDILEDAVRNKIQTAVNNFIKIYGKTAIPYGTYEIVRTYSPKYKKILPELLDVPHYTGTRIHSGNTAEDTEGCLLCGKNTVKGKVTNSREIFKTLDKWIEKSLNEGRVYIKIVD